MPLKGLTPSTFASFPSPKPNLGTNTGDATATAPDIVNGKTAYGPLGKITGTALHEANGTGTTDAGGLLTVSGLSFRPKLVVLLDHASGSTVLMGVCSDGTLTLSTQNAFAAASSSAWVSFGITINANGFTSNSMSANHMYDWVTVG